MKRMYIYSTLIIVCLIHISVISCDETSNPTPTVPGNGSDDSGDGNGNGGNGDSHDFSKYGALFFENNETVEWQTDSMISIIGRNIVIENTDTVSHRLECFVKEPIDFQNNTGITFVWYEENADSVSYIFSISEIPERWQDIRFRDGGDLLRLAAMNAGMLPEPIIHCRFEFAMPPASILRIRELRAFAN